MMKMRVRLKLHDGTWETITETIYDWAIGHHGELIITLPDGNSKWVHASQYWSDFMVGQTLP